mgnify:CR=1 FL=1
MSSNIIVKRICDYCKNTFDAKTTKTKYCSHICNSRGYKLNQKLKKIETSDTETKSKVSKYVVDVNSKDFLTFLKFLVFWFYEAYNYANKKEIKLYKDYLNTIGNFTNKYDDKEFVKIVLNLEKFFQNINSNINLNILSINLILELSQIKTKG